MRHDRERGVVDPETRRAGLDRARFAAGILEHENSCWRIRAFAMTADEYGLVATGLEGIDTDDLDGHERVAIGFRVTSWCGESCSWAFNWDDTEWEMVRQLRLVVEALRDFRSALVEIDEDLRWPREAPVEIDEALAEGPEATA